MIRLHKLGIVLAALLLALLGGCVPRGQTEEDQTAAAPPVTGTLSLRVLKVGQADAMILQTGTHCAVIDCGEAEDGQEVAECLADQGIDRVDYLILTHFDKDHVGGVPGLLARTAVEQILCPDYQGEGDAYQAYLDAIAAKGLTPRALTQTETLTLDDVLLELLPPQRKSYAEGDNDFSLAVSVTHGENRLLFTGDAEEARLSELLRQTQGTYDFLKVPHHGKYNSVTKKFLEQVRPSYGVVCDSEKNPAESRTLDALETVGCRTYCTKDGDVTVESDGKALRVTQK